MKTTIVSHGLLTPLDRQGNTIHQCCQCKQVRDINGVYSYRLFGNRRVSHGYCKRCHDQVMENLKKGIKNA